MKYNVLMIQFEWDPSKAVLNLKKHGVTFEEARSTFYDEFAIQFFDGEHSAAEERFLLLGLSSKGDWRTDPNHFCPQGNQA